MNATTLTITLALLAAPAFGQAVHKCPQPDGTVRYQGTICPDGLQGRIPIHDNGSGSGLIHTPNLRPGEQAGLAAMERREQQEAARRQAAAEARRIAEAPPPAPKTNIYDVMKENERQSSENLRALYRLWGRGR